MTDSFSGGRRTADEFTDAQWGADSWFELGDDAPPSVAHYTAWLPPAPTTEQATADPATHGTVPAAPPPLERQGRKVSRRSRWLAMGAGAVSAAVVAMVVVVVRASAPDPAPAVARISAVPASGAAGVAECAQSAVLPRITGNGPGSTASGPEAVLALEYAYYVHRSVSAVRELLVPGGPFGTDDQIQAGIDAVPAATRHCVEITPAAGADRWTVTITEHRPAGSTVLLHQTITTARRDDQTLIAAVEPA